MNIFTIDLEDWYHANYHSETFSHHQSLVEEPTLQLLKLLRDSKSKATFFVLGTVAKEHPDLIKEISHQGHEIASHGYSHQLVYSQTISEFEKDLDKSLVTLNKIVSSPILGYRAPSWSVSQKDTPWFWKTLKKHGLKYSSSIFPIKNFLYGDSTAFTSPHSINGLLEIPITIAQINKIRIPFSGGFYLRFLPEFFINQLAKHNQRHHLDNIFYIHPREILTNQPRLANLNLLEYFIHYVNINNTYHKLSKILTSPTISLKTAYLK